MAEVRVRRGSSECVPELEELWTSLNAHHMTVAGPLGDAWGFRSLDDSWRVRRAEYLAWLAEPDAFVLIAEDAAGRKLGYAVVRFGSPSALLRTGEHVAILESLNVIDGARGLRIGSALMAEVQRTLATLEVDAIEIGVLTGNQHALDFYRLRGMAEFVTILLGRVAELNGAGISK
jgi:ribosomal protein S18 acetylase RimI-like enzyme